MKVVSGGAGPQRLALTDRIRLDGMVNLNLPSVGLETSLHLSMWRIDPWVAIMVVLSTNGAYVNHPCEFVSASSS